MSFETESAPRALLLSQPLDTTPLSWPPTPWLPPTLLVSPPLPSYLLCLEPGIAPHPLPGSFLHLTNHGALPSCPGQCQLLMIPVPGEPSGLSGLAEPCSTLILEPCGPADPLLLQPQVLGRKGGGGLGERRERGAAPGSCGEGTGLVPRSGRGRSKSLRAWVGIRARRPGCLPQIGSQLRLGRSERGLGSQGSGAREVRGPWEVKGRSFRPIAVSLLFSVGPRGLRLGHGTPVTAGSC
uniref:Doublesex- and mab-3-related transcription factor C1/C2 C-terminal domain-containing protein n=1 Tax=Sarcophilus harrisii TaxID=9305 RepID=A0A7N4NL23_SARHA